MAEVAKTKLDAQQQQPKVAISLKSETNSVAAEEEEAKGTEKAGASESESKSNDLKMLSGSVEDSDKPAIDKLDELSSLEQEIAKMHNIQHCADSDELETKALVKDAGSIKSENGSNGNNDSLIMDGLTQATRGTPENMAHIKKETAAKATLEDVDLIALLKGTDQDHPTPAPAPTIAAALVAASADTAAEEKSSLELALAELDNVGVTIEGEGQYEIMEIDDGDNASGPSPVLQATASPKTGKQKLSPEQARAVALEQMADLKAHSARRKEAVAKQQQQQQQLPQQPIDIINSLNDDWNEYDSSSDNNSISNSISIAAPATKKMLAKKTKVTTADSPTLANAKAQPKPTIPKSTTDQGNSIVEPLGFKRTRVIKRKIIWDPDVPETQKSFAQYAKGTASPTAVTAAAASPRETSPTKGISTASDTPKRMRPSTPKEPLKVVAKRAATPSKLLEANTNAAAAATAATTPKRRSQTPSVPNGGTTAVVKKKKVSEIDRLMGDEGAANMMQAVEREQRELSGGELPNKPLMRKRSLTLTVRQPQKAATSAAATTVSNEVLSTSPKKESAQKSNKRGGGSSIPANSNNTDAVDAVFKKATKSQASDSWDYVYKQRASEESMIMRRRSNSSYSSNASVNRLSLDTKPAAVANLSDDASDTPPASDPSFKFLKPETKANQRSDGTTPQTLANDLKRGVQQQKETTRANASKVELVSLHKLEKVSHLIIHPQLSKTGYTYKLQLLQKLTEMLNKVAKSSDCNTVLLTVQGHQFCQGIECQELIAPTLEKRKSSVNQFALVLKTYLRTLATFPKPLVAGIVGNLTNLGVMQLPLLDFVVAAEDCSFETSYARLGQLPEGFSLWQKHQKVSSQVHKRLFLLGERLQTSDLLEAPNSFIDKSCQAHIVKDAAIAVAQLISSTTADHYRLLKKQNSTTIVATLQNLDTEFKILTEQWSSASFQANYKRYVHDLKIYNATT